MSRSSSPTSCLNFSAPSLPGPLCLHPLYPKSSSCIHWLGYAYLLPGSGLPEKNVAGPASGRGWEVPRTLSLTKPRSPWFFPAAS